MKIETISAGCVVQRKGREILHCAVQEADADGHTSFHVLLGNDWYGFQQTPHWAAVSMAGIHAAELQDTVVVAVAADGRTWELTPTTRVESLHRVADGFCGVTRLAALSDGIWACGMGRAAWRREGAGRWVDVSAPRGVQSEGVTGFTAIGEVEPGLVVAPGWKGEIWLRSRGEWLREDSPTDANFNALSCGPDGQTLIVGDRGALVSGKRGRWAVLDTHSDFNLHGVCHFGGEVFVCSAAALFRLVDGRLRLEDRFDGGDQPRTCMSFVVGRDCLYSQGERDLFRFQDGAWSRVI